MLLLVLLIDDDDAAFFNPALDLWTELGDGES